MQTGGALITLAAPPPHQKKMTVWKLTQEDKLGKEIKIAWLFINRLYNVRQADFPNFQ